MKLPEHDIYGLAECYPDNISDHLLLETAKGVVFGISDSARFGDNVRIGSNVTIGESVIIGDGAAINDDAEIHPNTVICDDVVIGQKVEIEPNCLILARSQICPHFVISGSTNARFFQHSVSIGEDVILHSEVELGEGAIIPNQRTIAHIGYFGLKNRVVTIYGSDEGPKYSIGCQIGIDLDTFKDRVANSSNTIEISSNTYAPFLDAFQEIGSAAQKAYDESKSQVAEIKAIRQEFGLDEE